MASIALPKDHVNLRSYKNQEIWDIHKASADKVADVFSEFGDSPKDRAKIERLRQCAGYISFAWFNENNQPKFHLVEAHYCRARYCPICAWRRSLMLKARFSQNIYDVIKSYPKAKFIFLTLTVKNVPVEELKKTLKEMNLAFKRMYQSERLKKFVLGYIRNVEVTRSKDDECHPHFHIILMVKSSYFSCFYVNQREYTDMWQSALRINYIPVVNVKTLQKQQDRESVVKEIFKYCVKEQDIHFDKWYYDLMAQLKGARLITTSGALRNVVKDVSPETDQEMIHINDNGIAERLSANINFKWNRPIKRYRQAKD